MGTTRKLVVVAVLALLPLPAATPATGFAVVRAGTYKVKWSSDVDGVPCGVYQFPVYRTCNVKFAYSSAVTARSGWASAVSVASSNWCHTYDPKRAYANVFCYWNYTAQGGVGGFGVGVGALDLGGPNADGTQTLAVAEFGDVYVDPLDNGWASLQAPFISINTYSAIKWYANANASYTVPAGYSDLQTTMTHEFGHTLGLDHPIKGFSATGPVMQCLTSTGAWNHGRTDDFNGLTYIYSDRTKTPGSAPC